MGLSNGDAAVPLEDGAEAGTLLGVDGPVALDFVFVRTGIKTAAVTMTTTTATDAINTAGFLNQGLTVVSGCSAGLAKGRPGPPASEAAAY